MLRLIKVLVLVSVLLFAGLSVCLHFMMKREGSRLVRAKLTQMFRRPVTVGNVRMVFPMKLVVDDIEAKGLFRIKRAVLRGDMPDLLSPHLILSELRLTGAEISLVKDKKSVAQEQGLDAALDAGNVYIKLPPGSQTVQEKPQDIVIKITGDETVSAASGNPSDVPPSAADRVGYFFVKKLIITDGTVNFHDPNKGENGVRVTVNGIHGHVRNLQFPAVNPVITSFDLSGVTPWENEKEEGTLRLSGWLNLVDKDMRATVEMRALDGLKFFPYCQDWLNSEKANIARAKLDFKSEITGLKNDVVMDCHLDVSELQFKQRQEGERKGREEKITNLIAGMLGMKDNGKMSLDFKIRTAMDSPEFGFGVIKSAFETKVSEAITREANKPGLFKTPVRVVRETFKTVTDLTRSVINGTVGVGSALTGYLRQAFDRENQVHQQAEQLANGTSQ